jgi:hypothetical protein
VVADALQYASIGLMIANPVGAIQGIVGNAVGSNAERSIAAFYTKRGFVYSGPTRPCGQCGFPNQLVSDSTLFFEESSGGSRFDVGRGMGVL